MFNDSDNGQTQYCEECQKWAEKCEKLEKENRNLKIMTREEFDSKVEKYINAILLCFAEQIVNDLDKNRDKGIRPFINVDAFLPFLKKAIAKAKGDWNANI